MQQSKPEPYNYERGQITRVLEAGAEPETGGKYKLKITGKGSAATHWLSVTEEQVQAIMEILA
jgi:hypothetical protein